MNPPADPSPPTRGTIILDASGIIGLAFKVAPALRKDGMRPDSYLDTLRFLSQHGFRVLIPEVALPECSNVLPNGRSIRSLFHDRTTGEECYGFLRDAVLPENDMYKEFPNIVVAHNTGPEEVDTYCRGLEGAATNEKRRKNDIISTINNTKSMLQQFEKKPSKASDRAVLSILKAPDKWGVNSSTLVLTDDMALIERVRKSYAPIQVVSSTRFLYMLGESGIAKGMGFVARQDGEFFRNALRDAQAPSKHRSPTTSVPYSLVPYKPVQREAIEKYDVMKSMGELANALRNEPALNQGEAPAESEVATDKSEGMQRFMARYRKGGPNGGSGQIR